ncbi:MAG: transglutaminase family protein [Segniliparus sp.]|uniref:transglutaminase family protein n=1 Tax=Segniliparus sp. TaxID=2804064 RepID=UPI003F3D1EC6
MSEELGMREEPRGRLYRVTHRTVYEYDDDVTSSYGRGFLCPRDFPGQRRIDHELVVDPEPEDSSTGVDAFGNHDLYFHVTQTHRRLVVDAQSTVAVAAEQTSWANWDDWADWEDVRLRLAQEPLVRQYVIDLDPPEITDEVLRWAAPTFAARRPLVEVVAELTHRIYKELRYDPGSTTVATKVSEVLAQRSGVCQDFARLAIACLRGHGLAARYVSGYLLTNPPPGQPKLVGADATHAWAAVCFGEDRWLAFDPTNNQLVSDEYITCAWGRDYADVPPLRGVIYSEAKTSTIGVSVDVAEL